MSEQTSENESTEAPDAETTATTDQSAVLAEKDAEIAALKSQLTDAQTAQSATTAQAAAAPPADAAPVVLAKSAVSLTQFDGLTVSVRRNTDKSLWECYVVVAGAEWILAARKLGGFDDDLQEAATPGYREKKREYYEREVLGLR